MKLKKVKGFALNLQYVEYLVNFFLKKVMGLLDCIHVTPGPFGVYSKKILQEVGGFDTDNLTEDLEMALRLQKRNYKIIQLIGAKVFTLAPEKMKGWEKFIGRGVTVLWANGKMTENMAENSLEVVNGNA